MPQTNTTQKAIDNGKGNKKQEQSAAKQEQPAAANKPNDIDKGKKKQEKQEKSSTEDACIQLNKSRPGSRVADTMPLKE